MSDTENGIAFWSCCVMVGAEGWILPFRILSAQVVAYWDDLSPLLEFTGLVL